MKKLAFSLVAFGATIVMSCGGSSSQREQDVQDSLRQDSIKKIEAINDSLRRDSIAKDSIRQDSLWRYRVTPDLATFDLRGPVKSVSSKKITTTTACIFLLIYVKIRLNRINANKKC